jgi:2-iminobutanoate/2-iminopropanoate deaminase
MSISFQNFETAAYPYGPYSHAVTAGPFVFLSGHSGRDVKTAKVINGDIKAQTEQALLNIEAVLKGVGLGFEHIVKTTIYLADIADFAAVNAVYEKKFTRGFPARSTFQVTLPFGALVAFDAIAYKG